MYISAEIRKIHALKTTTNKNLTFAWFELLNAVMLGLTATTLVLTVPRERKTTLYRTSIFYFTLEFTPYDKSRICRINFALRTTNIIDF